MSGRPLARTKRLGTRWQWQSLAQTGEGGAAFTRSGIQVPSTSFHWILDPGYILTSLDPGSGFRVPSTSRFHLSAPPRQLQSWGLCLQAGRLETLCRQAGSPPCPLPLCTRRDVKEPLPPPLVDSSSKKRSRQHHQAAQPPPGTSGAGTGAGAGAGGDLRGVLNAKRGKGDEAAGAADVGAAQVPT